jgi:hypothetical protein
MFMYRLGKDLGLPITQVLEMSQAEFMGWAAFYRMEADENKKAYEKAKRGR